MSASSNYLENRVLDYWLKANSLSSTAPATVYVALFTSDPSLGSTDENLEAGTLTNECSGGAYARQAATFGSISNGSVSTSATITFPTATDNNWSTITHVAVMDGDTEGSDNVLWWGRLDVAKLIESGDTFSITSGSLTVTLA
ncbi:hypothetical protein [Phage DSL-LC06]|nr:hypothetical protein [Phage DSL-LC06]